LMAMSGEYPLEKARAEVASCIRIWKKIITERFSDKIEYAYVKGSSTKDWESPIDYVPELSDVDIHIMPREGCSLITALRPFEEALKISREYEEEFLRQNPAHLHVPRSQIVNLNPHLADPGFMLTSVPEENMLVGKRPQWKTLTAAELRRVDLNKLTDLRDTLSRLPESAMDRIGIDYVVLIRRLNYEVSPTPVRLLSQIEGDPHGVWEWNRTMIHRSLRSHGFDDVAESYREYYLTGWEVFRTGFRDNNLMRRLLGKAFDTLQATISHVEEMRLI